MTDPLNNVQDLLACPCAQHGALERRGENWVALCCGQVFTVQSGVLVLLPTKGN